MPASALFAIKKRKNRYDQLESTSDQVDDAEQVEQAMLNESNSQYVTLVNQSDDENKNAFENVNFFYPTEDDETEKLDDSSSSSTHCPIDPLIVGEKQRRTPPPIPARRQSNKDTEQQQQHHVVPPPIPAPPRRNDSRKGRKRPTYLETSQSSMMMGNQLFPTEIAHRHLSASLTLDSISTTEPMLIRTSVSHDFGDTKTTDDDIAQLLLPSASIHRQTDSRIGHHEGGGPLKKEEDDYSDFEIIDLVLADDSNGDSSSDNNDDRQNIKGSTNNLADFDDVEDAQLEEKIEQMTLTQSSTVDFANSPPDAIMDHHGHHHGGDEEEKGDFQTEKLLKLTNDASIRALVKLPKSRRQKFRTRSNWAQVSLSIGAGSCQVHNDDQQRGGRVIESVPFYSDVQLSAICADYSSQHKIVYYVKLLKVTYKSKRSTTLTAGDYSAYPSSSDSPFGPFVTRVRPLLKIGSRDYRHCRHLASALNAALLQTGRISDETNLMTPSTNTRVIIDVFDEVNGQLDSNNQVMSSAIETSLTLLSFGVDKLTIVLNDANADLSAFADSDDYQTHDDNDSNAENDNKTTTIEPLNIRTHSTLADYDYDKQTGVLSVDNPINGAKIELARFETRFDASTANAMPLTLKTEYAIVGGSKSCAITSSLHLNAKENIKNLAIRLPIVPSWREAIRADRAFTSITSGTYCIENDALVWSLGSVTSDDARQEFMSVKFATPGQIPVMQAQVAACVLEFECDDTRLSRTRIRLMNSNAEERNISHRSHYSLRVGTTLRFTP